MRLIDADTLVKEICKISCNKDRNACPHINSCFETGCKTVVAIENAPTIEAEPVVHCKDCTFARKDDFRIYDGIESHFCGLVEGYNPPDWFCADGVRR